MSVLPPNSTRLERALEASTERISAIPVPIADAWNADSCPESLLPWLAWSLCITDDYGWSLCLNVEQKRALIKQSMLLHRKKGTPWAVQEALKAVGFADARVVDSLPVIRYNGTSSYGGADDYSSGARWAMFNIVIDLGESRPFSADERARVVRTVNAWKRLSTKLYAVSVQVNVSDTVKTDESTTLVASLPLSDSHLPGARYDGSLTHSHGAAFVHDGSIRCDGAHHYLIGRATGQGYDNVRDPMSFGMKLDLSDTQRVSMRHDSEIYYAGADRYGADNRFAEDLPMQIKVTRHQLHGGRQRYSGALYSGANQYASQINHGTHRTYSGNQETYLEAA